MGVTEYLQRARDCADMAERMTPADKKKLLAIADAWLALADDAAKKASKPDGKSPRADQT